MSTSSHSEPRSFNTSESLEGEMSGRRRAVEEGEEESRDLVEQPGERAVVGWLCWTVS